MSHRFEIRYLIAAPVTLFILAQFIFLAWLDKRLPRWAFSPLIFVFVIEDVLYNATVGWFLFGTPPRQWLFTDRLNEMGTVPERERFALVLNHYDGGHVK